MFPDGIRAPLSQRRADALVAICQDTARPSAGAGGSVPVFVDATEAAATNAEAGVTLAGGPRVGPHTLEAVLCDGTVEVTAVTADGTPLGIGRRSRVVPPRLRRFVLFRDGGVCRRRLRLDLPAPGTPQGPVLAGGTNRPGQRRDILLVSSSCCDPRPRIHDRPELQTRSYQIPATPRLTPRPTPLEHLTRGCRPRPWAVTVWSPVAAAVGVSAARI